MTITKQNKLTFNNMEKEHFRQAVYAVMAVVETMENDGEDYTFVSPETGECFEIRELQRVAGILDGFVNNDEFLGE